MKRELFVFAGQSNMVGAGVYPPRREVVLKNSFEYKHKPRRLGAAEGAFISEAYPCGEFSYIDVAKAYADGAVDEMGRSTVADYSATTYFSTSMSNLDSDEARSVLPFATFSESTARYGATLAPFLCEAWERMGRCSAYAHIAKGGVPIHYYFTEEMVIEYNRRIDEYNRENGTEYVHLVPTKLNGAEYFAEKCRDFFLDAEKRFSGDDMSERCFFWLQGESEGRNDVIEYETKLEILWDYAKSLGFTRFFCIRVDYFGFPGIYRVMRAQENFTEKHGDAYMLTRAASYLTFPGQEENGWFNVTPGEEYRDCRDSCFGFRNDHINEKGFMLIAERAAQNLYRVLIEGQEPILEPENIVPLLTEQS